MQRTHFTAGYTLNNSVCDKYSSSELNLYLYYNFASAHTLGAVGSRHSGARGSSWGFGALLKGLTSVVDNSCRSRDSNPQPRVTSQTLYPLEPRLPHKEPRLPRILQTIFFCHRFGTELSFLNELSLLLMK